MATRTRIGLCSTLGALCCALAARADAGSDALARAAGSASQVADKATAVQPLKADLPPVCTSGQLAPIELRGTERLTYALDVLGANLGTLELSLAAATGEGRAKGEMVVEARGRSSDMITTNVKRIVGWSSTVVGKDGAPLRYREEIDEGDVHRAQDIEFPAAGGALRVRATKNGDPEPLAIAATPDARDLLSGLFVLRHQPLTPGAASCAEIYAARRMWRVEGKVADKPEEIDSPNGKVQAIRVDTVATRVDDPKVVRKAHVWLTTDERRLPVVILGEIRGRFVRAQLTEAKLGRGKRRTASRTP